MATDTRGTVPDRVRALEPLGVQVAHDYVYEGEVGVNRHRIDLLDTVHSVFLPLTPVDWCHIAMREGEGYMGGCCGNMGVLQDTTNGVFRDGGWADAGAMLTIGEMARGHEGFEETFPEMDDDRFAELVQAWHDMPAEPPEGAVFDPWWKVGIVFNAVEPQLKLARVDTPSTTFHPDRRSEDRDLLHVVANTAGSMAWNDMFTRDDPEDLGTHELNRVVAQARLYPMVRRLADLLEGMGVAFDGFGLVEPGTDNVLSNMRGLCLYRERAHAERIMELWARDGDTPADLVSVTVDVKDGLVVHR